MSRNGMILRITGSKTRLVDNVDSVRYEVDSDHIASIVYVADSIEHTLSLDGKYALLKSPYYIGSIEDRVVGWIKPHHTVRFDADGVHHDGGHHDCSYAFFF